MQTNWVRNLKKCMKSRFVDTNIFLEVFARTGKKSTACVKYLEEETGLWTNYLVMSEIEWTLRSFYNQPREEIADKLHSILKLDNLRVASKVILIEAVEIYRETSMDWVDVVCALEIRESGNLEIISYDKHFDKLGFLRRREP